MEAEPHARAGDWVFLRHCDGVISVLGRARYRLVAMSWYVGDWDWFSIQVAQHLIADITAVDTYEVDFDHSRSNLMPEWNLNFFPL